MFQALSVKKKFYANHEDLEWPLVSPLDPGGPTYFRQQTQAITKFRNSVLRNPYIRGLAALFIRNDRMKI